MHSDLDYFDKINLIVNIKMDKKSKNLQENNYTSTSTQNNTMLIDGATVELRIKPALNQPVIRKYKSELKNVDLNENFSLKNLNNRNTDSCNGMRINSVVRKKNEVVRTKSDIVQERTSGGSSDGSESCVSTSDAASSTKMGLKRTLSKSIKNSLRRSFSRTHSSDETKDRSKMKPKRSASMRIVQALTSPLAMRKQPPAPLLVEDPPTSEDGSDLEEVKHPQDPALLNGSSGNFGSAGARSAPSTPAGTTCLPVIGGGQGLSNLPSEPLSTPCSPAALSPSIHRSPSHSVFTNRDKASLKHLSTSTPAMTAQAQLTEPPSPKTTKEAKVHTTSKARQKKFHRHFPSVDEDEKVLNYYSCALIGDILLQGHLYITKNYFAFYSNVFGYVTKLLIPMLSVEKITKEKTARIIPNAVGISTSEDKHVFGSLMSRDNTYKYMLKVWEVAQDASKILEQEIVIVPSDSDTSETREGESGRESPPPPPIARIVNRTTAIATGKIDKDSPAHKNGHKDSRSPITLLLKDTISKLFSMPRQNLFLLVTTFLLILLFFSASLLLYRISRVQNRYSHILQGGGTTEQHEDVYGDLLQWQQHLHSKSAGAVYSFLDTNLDQIAKVRESLEALSTLLMPNNNPTSPNIPKANEAPSSSDPFDSSKQATNPSSIPNTDQNLKQQKTIPATDTSS